MPPICQSSATPGPRTSKLSETQCARLSPHRSPPPSPYRHPPCTQYRARTTMDETRHAGHTSSAPPPANHLRWTATQRAAQRAKARGLRLAIAERPRLYLRRRSVMALSRICAALALSKESASHASACAGEGAGGCEWAREGGGRREGSGRISPLSPALPRSRRH